MYTIIGSNKTTDLESDLEQFFKGEFLIDPRNSTKMEMDAYSIYSLAEGLNKDDLKTRLINGLYKNLELRKNKKFWVHNVWECDEIHFRFTSAALRILLYNKAKEFFEEKEVDRIDLLFTHISYKESLIKGQWFLHDSIEYDGLKYPSKHLKNNKLGSKFSNMLVYNTHFDTLITCMMYQKIVGINLNNEIKDALVALDFLLSNINVIPKGWSWFDKSIREFGFRFTGKRDVTSRIIYKIINNVYYKGIRSKLKENYNVFWHNDGFLERDMCQLVANHHYHVVNIWDFAKLLTWLNELDLNDQFASYIKIKEKLNKGIEYALTQTYLNFCLTHRDRDALVCHLLETLILASGLNMSNDISKDNYFKLREMVKPTPGILGFDMVISGIDCAERKNRFFEKNNYQNLDVVPLVNGGYFIANRSNYSVEVIGCSDFFTRKKITEVDSKEIIIVFF